MRLLLPKRFIILGFDEAFLKTGRKKVSNSTFEIEWREVAVVTCISISARRTVRFITSSSGVESLSTTKKPIRSSWQGVHRRRQEQARLDPQQQEHINSGFRCVHEKPNLCSSAYSQFQVPLHPKQIHVVYDQDSNPISETCRTSLTKDTPTCISSSSLLCDISSLFYL